jgi:sorting nexin-29
LEYGVSTFHLSIDFKAAYDTINREKLFEPIKAFKIAQKLIGLVRATSKHVICRVKMQNNVSEPIGTSMGLRQGDTLSYILFNLALEKAVRDSGIETNGTIYNKTMQILECAEYIDLKGRTTGVLKEAIINLSKAAKEMGFNNQSPEN